MAIRINLRLKIPGVYVSQLPGDITKDELMVTFSKYGLISEDYKTGEPRIKIYHNDDANVTINAMH